MKTRRGMSSVGSRGARTNGAAATSLFPSRSLAKAGDRSSERPTQGDGLRQGISDLVGVLRSWLVYALVACIYIGSLAVCRISNLVPRRRWTPTARIAATATFFNTQWFLAHIIPLTRSGVGEVIVVTERPLLALDKLRFWCPPSWMTRLTGRAPAKLASLLACGLACKPDVFVGFHLFPGAISALLVARVLGRPACYQMTGGPTEILGGGAYSENRLLAKLERPSALLEKLAIHVVRQFDLVVVRGSKARSFLMDRGIRTVTVITGSVRPSSEPEPAAREYDLVFVGRLAAIKQPLQFIDIVARVQREMPALRAAVVGDGPLLEAARERRSVLGLERNVEFLGQIQDVERILARSRLFVLTSRSEGLSIAMAEAMAAGVVPIVADVGDLGDLVIDGETGFLVTSNDVAEFARRALALLQDRQLWARQSQAAQAVARRHTSVEVVSAKWMLSLSGLVRGDGYTAAAAAEGGL